MLLKGEAKILKLCKTGNKKAQRLLFSAMKTKWMGLAVRYMKDTDLAKDVFQEAALKIFTDLHLLKDENAFSGWARRILINTALNHLKQKQGYLYAQQEYFVASSRQLEDGDDIAIAKMDNERLLNIIDEMPEGYRVVFNLFLIDGYSHKEIGERLNISESTSRSQLTKAKRYIKQILERLKKNEQTRAIGY